MENESPKKGGKIKIVIITVVILVGLLIIGTVAKRMMVSTLGVSESSYDRAGATGLNYSSPSSISFSNPLTTKSLSPAPDYAQSTDYSPTTEQSNPQNIEKKEIKKGDLTLKVSNTEDAASEISKIVKNNGGDVFSSNFYQNANNQKSGVITLKVPNDNFEKTFEEVKKVATLVVRESTNSQDVTAQYVDLESRLSNAKAEEQSYIQVLNRASTVEDILKVTRQLSQVRGEIEVMEGQKRYMDSQIDMSQITVNLSEDSEITISDSWRPLRTIKETVNSLLSDLKGFINFLIVLVIRVIPLLFMYLLLVLVAFLIGRKIYRKIKAKKAAAVQ